MVQKANVIPPQTVTARLVIEKREGRFVVQETEGFDWEGFAAYLKDRIDQNPAVAIGYFSGGVRAGGALRFLLKG